MDSLPRTLGSLTFLATRGKGWGGPRESFYVFCRTPCRRSPLDTVDTSFSGYYLPLNLPPLRERALLKEGVLPIYRTGLKFTFL